MRELTIVDLAGDADPTLLEHVYTRVLRPSFTRDELGGIAAVAPAPWRTVTVGLVADGTPVAAAVTEVEPDGVSLLAYLAVAPAARGLGAGARILAHLRGQWRAPAYLLVLAEVHDPRGHVDTDDEHPEARLRFYARAGAEVLDLPWVQPALDGGARVSHMLLLVLHREEAGPVPSGPVLTWARDYFAEAEGDGPLDAQAESLLSTIGQRPEIPVLPTADWRRVRPLGKPS